MSTKYKDIIVFSFGCEFDFTIVDALQAKYLEKGYHSAKFCHVVLTGNFEELTSLRKRYPHLAHEIVDIHIIQENDPSKLKCDIQQDAKVIIVGHGKANADYISSDVKEIITMPQLARLLKENCQDKRIAITLVSCHSGLGREINSVEGSMMEALYISLKEYEIEATISAPTTDISISAINGKREQPFVIADLPLILISRYGNTIEKQLASLSMLPWRFVRKNLRPVYDWVSTRDSLQELYDIETALLEIKFPKGLGSRVVLNADGSVYFPYGKFERDAILNEDAKLLYAYYDKQRIYRDEVRRIFLQHWENIVAENPEIENYQGLQRLKEIILMANTAIKNPEIESYQQLQHLKEIIVTCTYPYPALMGYIVDAVIDEAKGMQYSPEKGTWEVNLDVTNNPLYLQEERRNVLSTALESFKNRISTDLTLKAIQEQHTALARQTRYRLDGKNIALRDIRMGGWLAVSVVSIGIVVAKFFPIIVTFIVCMTLGSLACFILGQGFLRGYPYLLIEQGSKEPEKLDDIESCALLPSPLHSDQDAFITQEEPEASSPLQSTKQTGRITPHLMRHGFHSAKPQEITNEPCRDISIELHC